MPSRRLLAPALGALALGLGGCGGDDAPSTEELIAQGDAICTANNEDLRGAREEHEGIPLTERERASEAVEALNRPGEETTAELQALEAPEESRAAFDRFLDLREQRDAGFREVLAAVKRGDAEAASETQAETVGLVQGKLRQAAEQVGFEVCGQALSREGQRNPGP